MSGEFSVDSSLFECNEKLSTIVDIVLPVSSDSEPRSLNSFSSKREIVEKFVY